MKSAVEADRGGRGSDRSRQRQIDAAEAAADRSGAEADFPGSRRMGAAQRQIFMEAGVEWRL